MIRRLKLIVLLILALGVVPLVIQNREPVATRFLWMTAEVPAILLLIATGACGFVSGILVALLMKDSGGPKGHDRHGGGIAGDGGEEPGAGD